MNVLCLVEQQNGKIGEIAEWRMANDGDGPNTKTIAIECLLFMRYVAHYIVTYCNLYENVVLFAALIKSRTVILAHDMSQRNKIHTLA